CCASASAARRRRGGSERIMAAYEETDWGLAMPGRRRRSSPPRATGGIAGGLRALGELALEQGDDAAARRARGEPRDLAADRRSERGMDAAAPGAPGGRRG